MRTVSIGAARAPPGTKAAARTTAPTAATRFTTFGAPDSDMRRVGTGPPERALRFLASRDPDSGSPTLPPSIDRRKECGSAVELHKTSGRAWAGVCYNLEAERCRSGRTGLPCKQLGRKRSRGFESPPLRHAPPARRAYPA